jgi:hypothetical protein
LAKYAVGKNDAPEFLNDIIPNITAESEYVVLREAATQAFEQTLGSNAAMMAERPIGAEQPDVLGWYAWALFGKQRDAMKLYGTRPHSRKIERIAPELLFSCDFVDELNVLVERNSNIIKYENLKIRERELLRRIEIIKEW